MAIKEVLHTDLAPAAVGPYSQAIAANGFVFTSGQVPIDPKAGKIVATTIEEQTEQVMKNLQCVLAQGGVSFDRVVKTTCFLPTPFPHCWRIWMPSRGTLTASSPATSVTSVRTCC